MRILFLHAALSATSEYQVHRALAEYVDPDSVDCTFVWQDFVHDHSKRCPAKVMREHRNFFYDFGRDMSIDPRPSRHQRALMMARQLPGAIRFVSTICCSFRPDLIYTAQQQYDVYLARFLSRRFRIPHLIHVHYPVGPWLGFGLVHTIRHTPHVLTVSEFIRQTALLRGVTPDRIQTIHNPVWTSAFTLPRDPKPLQETFGLLPGTPVVVAAGRIDPGKGHFQLIDAFALVLQKLPHAMLLICGEPSTNSGFDILLRRHVQQTGIDASVIFAGYRNDLPMIFAGADIFCLPTELEAFALVFLEAMSAGLPVVAYHSGGVPELVQDRVTGLLSPVGDIAALAANLLLLLENPVYAEQLSAAAKELVTRSFSPERIAARWADILTTRLGGGKGHYRPAT